MSSEMPPPQSGPLHRALAHLAPPLPAPPPQAEPPQPAPPPQQAPADAASSPQCQQCHKTETLMWRKIENGQICQECYLDNGYSLRRELEPEPQPDGSCNPGTDDDKKLRKSPRMATRQKTAVAKPAAAPASAAASSAATAKSGQKGKVRRWKAPVMTIPEDIPNKVRIVDRVMHEGSYLSVGDIVSLMDRKDNLYYAQIRGLLIDWFCEKTAYITWLLPTTASPPPNERFDPETYLIGFEDDNPKDVRLLRFVMHAPSRYYFDKKHYRTPTSIYDPPEFTSYVRLPPRKTPLRVRIVSDSEDDLLF